MAAFHYIALTESGRQKKGTLEADTPRQIRKQLREMGLAPVSVDEVIISRRGNMAAGKSTGKPAQRQRLSAAELALLTRQLATLIQAGLPLDESLTAVAEQCDKARIKSIVLAVRAGVLEGNGLAESFAGFPHVFDTLYRSMVAAGETSGNLDSVLMRLADYTEQRHALRQRTQVALMYPIILTIIALLVVGGLLAFVVPKIVSQFLEADQVLPMATTILIVISDAVKDYGLYALAGIALAIWGLNTALKGAVFRAGFDRWLLRLPMLGKVIRSVNTARFSRTLSILTSSGVPLLDALAIGGRVLTNTALQAAVRQATNHVREGTSLQRALAETKQFPPMMLHMIGSGEKSGKLDEMLERVACNQEREFDMTISMALALFEPLLIVVMGGVVMFIVMAILLPIIQMNALVA